MILYLLCLLIDAVACQGDINSFDWLIDCYDSGNTTSPQTECYTTIHCNCLLCAKNDPASSTRYCVYATNTTMWADNATWYCPAYDAAAIQECRHWHFVDGVFYFGFWLFCIGICVVGCAIFVCRCVCAAIVDRRVRRSGFTQL